MDEDYYKEGFNRQYYQTELRSLELLAYAEMLSAVRASGALDESKRSIVNFMREAFSIPEERHKAEVRRVASDERLGLIADMINGKDTSQEWTDEGYTPFPTLPHIIKYVVDKPPEKLSVGKKKLKENVEFSKMEESEMPAGFKDGWATDKKTEIMYAEYPLGDDFKEITIKSASSSSDDESTSEDEIPAVHAVRRRGPVRRTIASTAAASNKNKFTTAPGRGNNASPDITECPTSNVKRDLNRSSPAKRGRGAKRKISIGNRKSTTTTTSMTNKRVQKHVQNSRGKVMKSSNDNVRNIRSSAEPPEKHLITDDDIPVKRIKSTGDVSPPPPRARAAGRGRGLGRVRGGRGGRGGRGHGGAGRMSSSMHHNNAVKSPVASKIKIKISRPLKTKIKKPIPNSVGSRRKSKLKEKPIDDLIVEMRNYDDHVGKSYIETEMSTKKGNTQSCDNNLYNKVDGNFVSAYRQDIYTEDKEKSRSPLKKEEFSRGKEPSEEKFESSNNNNDEEHSKSNDKESWNDKSDVENACSTFGKGDSKNIAHVPVISHQPSEIHLTSGSNNSNSSSADDNEENENSSDTSEAAQEKLVNSKCKGDAINSQNQSPNSPTPLQSINAQQCAPPLRDLSSPPPIQQQKQRLKTTAGVNPSPGVIIQQPRNPLPAPVFSTSLNMSSFNKKRKMMSNSVVDSLNLHLSTSNVSNTATASSLATRRPAIIGTPGGLYSNNVVLTTPGGVGGRAGILHQTRKAHPHILSTSKAHRNFIPNNSNSSNSSNSLSSNNITLNSGSAPTINNISNCNSVVQPNTSVQSFTSAATISAISSLQQQSATNTTTTSVQNFPTQTALSVTNATERALAMGVSRAQGANIIFLQKANTTNTSTNATTMPNVLPVKSSPRAVILRRAQIPRQGNVMILDIQKNQLVNASQVPQFLQSARILSAPAERSVLNLAGGQPTRKIIQGPSSIAPSSSPNTTITYPSASGVGSESPFRQGIGLQTQINLQTTPLRKTKIYTQQPVVVTTSPPLSTVATAAALTTTTTAATESSNSSPNKFITVAAAQNCVPSAITLSRKDQIQPTVDEVTSSLSGKTVSSSNAVNSNLLPPCPIEAELMEMEQNDVYEEEVMTSGSDSNSNTEASSFPSSDEIPIQYNSREETAVNSNLECLETLRINHSPVSTPQSTPFRNTNNEGGSSTDTASENECSFSSMFTMSSDGQINHQIPRAPALELPEIYHQNSTTTTTLSLPTTISSKSIICTTVAPARSETVIVPPHAVEECIETTPITEDIFEAALKSSGINFNDSPFFVENEEDSSTNQLLGGIISTRDTDIASHVEVINFTDSKNISTE